MKKLQYLIWALAGGALLVALVFVAWPGSGSHAPTAFAPVPATAVPVAADSAPSAPAAAPAAVAPVASLTPSNEATAPAASPDVEAADATADRERAAQQRARVR